MHRFRKKSEVKRSQAPDFAPPKFQGGQESEPHDFLPPTDFRTSLILPDLSRRFSLLRTPTGDPVTFDDLRTRFAQQRAKGADHTIPEDVEEMLLETLGKLRGRVAGSRAAERSDESFSASVSEVTEESGSTSSTTIKLTKGGTAGGSSPARSKRYSNNLFGSGRLREYNYLRTVSSARDSAGGSSKTISITPSEDTSNLRATTTSYTDSIMSSSPPTGSNADDSVISLQSTGANNDQGSVRSTSSSVSESVSAAEYRLQKHLGPMGLKRASLALENVIKEIEDEELEEEIVMPRSTPIPRNHVDLQPQHRGNGQQQQKQLGEGFVRDSDASMLSSVIEAGMAISSDKPSDDENEGNAQRGPSPVPLGITPGYIPGMPRPMTPRDFEFSADELRSHSTTPRATSPMHGSFTLSDVSSASVAISNILRRETSSARQSPRPTTPLFLQRSTHGAHQSISSQASTSPTSGRFTPVDENRARVAVDLSSSTGSGNSFEFENTLNSSVLGGRRRPASPLANPPYHAISAMASTTTSSPPSRPTTPSNIIWGVKPDVGASPSSISDRPGHSRDNSWASEGDSDAYGSGFGETDDDASLALGVYKDSLSSANRSLRSPPRSDSPGLEKGQLAKTWSFKNASANPTRSTSPINGTGNGENHYQASNQRNHRSLTPTQNGHRSPTSPTFGIMDSSASSRTTKRNSRQNGYISSPFNLGPLPTLTLNPKANMSNSSLESAGSSFHSWEGEKDRLSTIFNDAEAQPAWHEFSGSLSEKSSTTSDVNGTTVVTSRTSPEQGWDPEDIIKGYAGLKKGDFAMIQEKLVAVAKSTENRGSALRKRRPSTSQSNYSVRDNRVASPPPASPVVNVHPNAREQQQIYVLNTCIDPQATLSAPILASSTSSSSIDRPNRNLAKVLFGQDEDTTDTESPGDVLVTNSDKSDPSKAPTAPLFSQPDDSSTENGHYPPSANVRTPTTPSMTLNRNPSSARLPPQTPQEQAALVLEVQQKVQAATLALRKRPSQEGLSHATSISRKKIDPSQISKPLFVSSSTSVDTIPLKTPALSASNSSGPSKIGSRFKKLRGSLRVKAAPIEETVTQPSETKVSPGPQSANHEPEKLKTPGAPSLASATDTGRFKVSVPSPPASAGPGLKGFMARFRTKRGSDIPQSSSSSISSDQHHSPQLPQSPLSPLAQSHRQFSSSSSQSRTPSQSANSELGHSVSTPRQNQYRQFSDNVTTAPQPLPPTSEMAQGGDNSAILQLFAAANNLGIDHGEINDLLKRSGSLGSRTLLSPTHDAPTPRIHPSGNPHGHHLTVPPIQQPNLSSSSGSDHTATPGMFNSSPVSDLSIGNNFSYNDEPTTPEEPTTAKGSVKRPDHFRRAKDVNGEANPIVRRTLIFADPRQSTIDPSMSRKNSMRRRRASVQSASNRSIHDRVPTPPPSKTPQGKRFSHEASPPVPQLPHALGGPENILLHVSAGHNEKAHSAAYDSLYELYGDSRSGSVMVDSNNPDFGRVEAPMNSETATGVEVIQLANGDIIWNVVNGLRDEDDESLYTGRNSIGSEYSTRESGENMQVFVKEHARASSKGSNASFVSRKKTWGKARPETKVLYGSPEQIGRLIESVSQGMDAGSFNFSSPYPSRSHTQGHGHSATSSVSTNDWAINEIDNILTSINRP